MNRHLQDVNGINRFADNQKTPIMTHQELIDQVRELYLASRKSRFPAKNIERCTSHSISSELEDLLALYCAELIDDPNVRIYIDPQLSFPNSDLRNGSGRRAFQLRPDLMIVSDNVARIFIDAKTDIGYKRTEYLTKIREKNELMATILNMQVKFNDGNRCMVSDQITIAGDISYTYFLASNRFITRSTPIDVDLINGLQFVNIFCATTGHHLNSYEPDATSVPNEEVLNQFDKLILSVTNKSADSSRVA